MGTMRKNDVILICVILIAGLLSFGGFHLYQMTKTKADSLVRVTVDGAVYGEYPLSEDTEVVIEDGDGSFNKLVIKAGYADITEADCPDRICVNHLHVHYTGETIVCLPNKVVVEIVGGEENEIDGSTY